MTDLQPPTTAVPFNGDLLELKDILTAESRARPGKWATRLVGNAYVAMRVSTTHRRWELLIWRDAAPVTLYEQSRWQARVRELQRSLRCLDWQRGADVHRGESVAAAFEHPLPSKPGDAHAR